VEAVPLCTDVPLFGCQLRNTTAPFLGQNSLSWWGNVQRFAYPDTSVARSGPNAQLRPLPLWDRGRLARIFWFLNTIRAGGTPAVLGG
jgi:hypothetical protein